MAAPPAYGLMASFENVAALEAAIDRAQEAGYRDIEAFSPVPVAAIEDRLGLAEKKIPLIALAVGIAAATLAYAVQYYSAVHDYPMVVGGKPLHSWPAFLLITFEIGVLSAVLAAIASMLVLNRYPAPYHPVFNVEAFEAASRDRFFLCIGAEDPRFDPDTTRTFLEGVGAANVAEVPR